MEKPKPTPKVYSIVGEDWSLNIEAVNSLLSLLKAGTQLAIFGAIGEGKAGKSTSMNNFLSQCTDSDTGAFAIGALKSVTKGIDACLVPYECLSSKIKALVTANICLLFLDCEGTQQSNKNIHNLYLFTFLLSSAVSIHTRATFSDHFVGSFNTAIFRTYAMNEIPPYCCFVVKDLARSSRLDYRDCIDDGSVNSPVFLKLYKAYEWEAFSVAVPPYKGKELSFKDKSSPWYEGHQEIWQSMLSKGLSKFTADSLKEHIEGLYKSISDLAKIKHPDSMQTMVQEDTLKKLKERITNEFPKVFERIVSECTSMAEYEEEKKKYIEANLKELRLRTRLATPEDEEKYRDELKEMMLNYFEKEMASYNNQIESLIKEQILKFQLTLLRNPSLYQVYGGSLRNNIATLFEATLPDFSHIKIAEIKEGKCKSFKTQVENFMAQVSKYVLNCYNRTRSDYYCYRENRKESCYKTEYYMDTVKVKVGKSKMEHGKYYYWTCCGSRDKNSQGEKLVNGGHTGVRTCFADENIGVFLTLTALTGGLFAGATKIAGGMDNYWTCCGEESYDSPCQKNWKYIHPGSWIEGHPRCDNDLCKEVSYWDYEVKPVERLRSVFSHYYYPDPEWYDGMFTKESCRNSPFTFKQNAKVSLPLLLLLSFHGLNLRIMKRKRFNIEQLFEGSVKFAIKDLRIFNS
eukprot:TRINITY_DN470_c1_g2_i3.p1 TRINITY_DN470_c1_g2~~TRINITY_DN470_c1_g2_i3.p1  ORF type:complete len:767 (-),score=37.21 TRINITY_DN470_c1_g2_i3:597-2654(-)